MRKKHFKSRYRRNFKKRYVVIPAGMLLALLLGFGFVKHLDDFNVENPIKKDKPIAVSRDALTETSIASLSEIYQSPYIDTTIKPFIEYSSKDEAVAASGMDSFNGYNPSGFYESFEAKDNEMMQVFYSDSSGNEIYRIRKAMANVQIDENYDFCDRNEEITVGKINVTARYQNEIVKLIKWNIDEYSYAVVFSTMNEISTDNLADYINNIK